MKLKTQESGIMSFNHVRHDPAHCLAPGLFRSLSPGERKRKKLDITYTYGNDSIRFLGPEPLGADDLRVLQGLIAMAACSGDHSAGIILTSQPKTPTGKRLRSALDLKWDAKNKTTMVAETSIQRLAREIGYTTDSGGVFYVIRKSIERLWTVSIIVERDGQRQGFRLLSQYASHEHKGKIFVAINPRIAEAIMGQRPHTRIEMAEVRALKTDAARLIHQRLCGWIDPGKSGRVDLDTLCSYVWPDKCSPSTMRKRRQRVRKALQELEEIGWTVKEYVKSKYEIARPKARE